MNPCSSVVVSMIALASITDSIRACPKEVPSSLRTQSNRGPAAQYGSTPMYVSTTPKRRTNEKVGFPSRTSPARENPCHIFIKSARQSVKQPLAIRTKIKTATAIDSATPTPATDVTTATQISPCHIIRLQTVGLYTYLNCTD
jgi:hypothetical protein